MCYSLLEGERETWGDSAGSVNHGPFLSIGMCWPKTPWAVKCSTVRCLRRCIKEIHGLRDQPLFLARSHSRDSGNCLKISLEDAETGESRPHRPCGGKVVGLQLRAFHSLNLIL